MFKPIPMFLLEVYDVADPDNRRLFKRRISGSILSIEDWVEYNAHVWASSSVFIKQDGYGNGVICILGNNTPIFEFTTTAIATI